MSWRDAPTEEGKLAAHRNNLGVLMLHPENVDDLALALQNLGMTNVRQGRFASAEARFTRALRIFRQIYPPGHEWIATVQQNLKAVRAERAGEAPANSQP